MTAAPLVDLCSCGHAQRVHGDDGCRLPNCGCSGYDQAEARPAASVETKTCTSCGKVKPRSEFYARNNDGSSAKVCPRCRDCDNTRTRVATPARFLRTRARHRATSELIERHRVEFQALLEDATEQVVAEAQHLAAAAAEQPVDDHGHQPQPAPAMPRLKPGPRRKGQDVTERLDVARCPECVGYHDRGHRCASCGAEPCAAAS
jgi:hypothetical protein